MADSEYRAYSYIESVLGALGWDTRNPARGGSVFTQGEFYNSDPLLTDALGRRAPENTVLIPWTGSYRYWLIEAKAQHKDLSTALAEAQDYATAINSQQPGTARFATGIAGTPDRSFYVATTYWDGVEWRDVAINNYQVTGFLSPAQCQSILDRNSPHILQYEVDLDLFLTKANQINQTLHQYGVAARDRAALVAGVLLALAQDSTMRIDHRPRTLVRDVNARIEELLTNHRREEVLPELELKLPATSENHKKYWAAIIQTMQHLREMNIRSAINSGTDALGQFYETFLKYANDASEMGIVLTPRHITRFAVDVVGIQQNDRVFDPTCGTGGFLVAALDTIRAQHFDDHPDVYNAFRNDCLYGVEQADDVFGLALVNMIFRGDGKSYIHNGNCFDNRFILQDSAVERVRTGNVPADVNERPFTRVLMNPPFAVNEKEHEFVDYALSHLTAGGLLFAILPNGPITGAQRSDAAWRKQVVQSHTVRAVVRMSNDLFSPNVNKGTYALLIEAWRPHRPEDDVLFAVLRDDEHGSNKSKLIGPQRAQDNVEVISAALRHFLAVDADVSPIPRELGVSKLLMSGSYDFASEAYLSDGIAVGNLPATATYGLLTALTEMQHEQAGQDYEVPDAPFREFALDELFKIERGKSPPLKTLEHGSTPVITTSEARNGIAGYYDVPGPTWENCVTISANGSGGRAFWHPYRFAASTDVLVCSPLPDLPQDHWFFLYVCDVISDGAWRFDYYRKCSPGRLRHDIRVSLPMRDGAIDADAIKREVTARPGYDQISEMLSSLPGVS